MIESDKIVFKELALMIAIAVVLSLSLFRSKSEDQTTQIPTVENFDEFPLMAWQTLDKDGGSCVKVRYAIMRDNTKLYMFDNAGTVVHEQPLILSPYKDGRDRVETYVWKLYRTEWSDYIAPGLYYITVGTKFDKRGLETEIEIL